MLICEGQRTTRKNWFSSSTLRVLGIQVSSSAISTVPTVYCGHSGTAHKARRALSRACHFSALLWHGEVLGLQGSGGSTQRPCEVSALVGAFSNSRHWVAVLSHQRLFLLWGTSFQPVFTTLSHFYFFFSHCFVFLQGQEPQGSS